MIRQDLTEARRIIAVVERAATDLAAVDERTGLDKAQGTGKVSVKDYVQDPETGRTYTGNYAYEAATGNKQQMDLYLRGDPYDDPDFLGVEYYFRKGTREEVYTRIDRVDSFLSFVEEAKVDTQTGEIRYKEYKQDNGSDPFPQPPFPPFPPVPGE